MKDSDRQLDDGFAEAARAASAGTPPAPDRRLLADGAKARAAALWVQGAGQRGRLRLRLGEAVVVLVTVAALIVLLLPWVRTRMPPGVSPTAPTVIDTAWASTEGHVIEFTVRYASWDDIPDYNAPFHPRREIARAVRSWLLERPDLQADVPGLPLTEVSTSWLTPHDEEAEVKVEVQVLVALADGELVAELARFVTAETAFDAPTVETQTVYYSHDDQFLASETREVLIDGDAYTYPFDFTVKEARSVTQLLNGARCGPYYSARYGFGISSRFGNCVIHRVETAADGALVITTITKEIDADPEIVRAIISSSARFEPDWEDLSHPWRDPVLELLREGRFSHWTGQARAGEAESRIDVAIYYISCRLVPEDKWESLEERRQRLIDEGREQLPPLTDEDWVEIEEWAAGLEEQLPADVLVETGKSWLELAREHHDDIRARMIDFETHDSEEYRSFPELTEAERSAAMQLAEQLREITRQWYADNARAVYESGPGAEINRRVRYIGEIPVSFHVTLKCNDAEFVDSLRETLEGAPGLVQQWEVTESSLRHSVGTDDQPPPIIGG